MASRQYHGADASITVSLMDGTSITVGELRNINIREQFEVDDYYSADSIKRSATKQRNFSVLVEYTVGAFDISLIQEFHGGSGGASSHTMTDTTDPALFQVVGQVTQHGQSTDLKATVDDCRFDGELPIHADVSHDAWVDYNGSLLGVEAKVEEA